MKKIIVISLLITLLFSCNDKVTNSKILAENIGNERFKEYYGIWTGDIEPVYEATDTIDVEHGKITIKINRIIGDDVYGQSITAGTQRPFKGKVKVEANDVVTFTLDEPGTNKYDGRFQLEIIGNTLRGNHIAFKQNPETTKIKKISLIQKDFVYNPNNMIKEGFEIVDWENPKQQQFVLDKYYDEEAGDTIEVTAEVDDTTDTGEKEVFIEELYRIASEEVYKINASIRRLTEEELKNLRKLDLEIIRNSIYARHGYSFKKGSIRYFFEVTDWYVPISDNVDKELTMLEKDNIKLLTRLEKYAEDHYDTFGR